MLQRHYVPYLNYTIRAFLRSLDVCELTKAECKQSTEHQTQTPFTSYSQQLLNVCYETMAAILFSAALNMAVNQD